MGSANKEPTSRTASHTDVGKRLKTHRERAGLTQTQTVERVNDLGLDGYDQSALSKVERGVRALGFLEAVCLAEVFNVPANAFAFDDPATDAAANAARAEVTRAVRAAEEARAALGEFARAQAEAERLVASAAEGMHLYPDDLAFILEPLGAARSGIGASWEEIQR